MTVSLFGAKLDEVRSVARARSVESFEYFALYVLGLRSAQGCESLAQRALQGETVSLPSKSLDFALTLWLDVLGVHDVQSAECDNEVFSWLFPECAKRRVA